MTGEKTVAELSRESRSGADHHARVQPQSNGLAEAFVKTFKRNYVDGAEPLRPVAVSA